MLFCCGGGDDLQVLVRGALFVVAGVVGGGGRTRVGGNAEGGVGGAVRGARGTTWVRVRVRVRVRVST